MNCKKCGNEIEQNAKFCPICGAKNEENNINFSNIETTKKNNSKKIIIAVSIILGAILIFILGIGIGSNAYFINNKSDEINEKDNDEVLDEKNEDIEYTFDLFKPSEIKKISNNGNELTKQIAIEEIFFNPQSNVLKTEDAYIYGKNNNSVAVEVNVFLEYYDSEGYRLEKRTSTSVVLPNKEFVLHSYVENDSLKYSSVKLTYEANNIKSYHTVINSNNMSITSNLLNDGNIDIIVENNSNIEMSMGKIACLYYKEGKIVFAQDTSIVSLQAGQKNNADCYAHKLYLNSAYDSQSKIEFDDTKVILFSAYNSDSTNY